MSYPRRQTAARVAASERAAADVDRRIVADERLDGRPLPDPETMTVEEMRAEITAWWAAYDAETLEVRARLLPVEEQATYMIASARRATAYARRQRELEGYIVIADRAALDEEPPARIAQAQRARAAHLGVTLEVPHTQWKWHDGLAVEDARRWLRVLDAIRRPTAHV